MEEQKMTKNKNQERSEDHELNIQRILARNVCKITEDGRILWNEAIVVKLLEKTGICRVDSGGDHKRWVYNNGETVDFIRPDHLILHLIGFLRYIGQHDITDFLVANYTYLSDNVINAIKEESYEDVFGFEDDELYFTDDDCSLSENPPPPRWEAPTVPPREALDLE